MCVILIGNISQEQYRQALAQNGDGFSLFTEAQGLIKSPSRRQVEEALGKFGIWHFRIATSGTVDQYNIHPFRVCDSKYLLYHNGVLGSGLKGMSDTHALAETLQNVGVETAKSVLASLSDNNKFVLVDAHNPKRFYLFGKWVAEAGVLMSHKLVTGYYRSYTGGQFKIN